MTDLEMLYKSTKEKYDTDKKTAKEMQEVYRRQRTEQMGDLFTKILFLNKYGINVQFKSEFGEIFLSKESYPTAKITATCQFERIGEEIYQSLIPNTYWVNWAYNSCNKGDGKTYNIEERVKAIADKFK